MPLPANAANTNALMMGAVKNLTEQLVTLNDHFKQVGEMVGGPQVTAQQRSEQSVAASMSGPLSTRAYSGRQEQLPGVAWQPQPAGAEIPDLTTPAAQQPYKAALDDWGQIKATRQRQGGSYWKAAKAVYAPPPDEVPTSTAGGASVPPTTPPPSQVAGEPSDSASEPVSLFGGEHPSNPIFDPEQALTFGVLGEHGGPSFIRNAYLGTYAMQRQLSWAQAASANLEQQMPQGQPGDENYRPGTFVGNLAGHLPGVSQANMATLSGLLGVAAEHPIAAYAVSQGIQGFGNLMGAAGTTLANYQSLGNQLGYGGSGGPPQNIFGIHDPLSLLFGPGGTATAEGASLQYSALRAQGMIPGQGFGAGLSAAQASGDMADLAAQGFANQKNSMNVGTTLTLGASDIASKIPVIGGALSDIATPIMAGVSSIANDILKPLGINWFSNKNTGLGDANTIESQFIEPLQRAVPGLSSADATQFASALRNASTSTAQLSDTFSSFNDISKTAKMSVGDVAAAFNQVATAAENMGATQQQGLSLAATFAGATGLNPAAAIPAMQNPLIQGLMMSQNGVLPSGIPAAGGGLLGTATLSAIQMVQRATAGLDRTQYRTLSNGQRVPIVQGKQEQEAQIASMFPGLPPSMINRIIANPKAVAMGSNLETLLGSSGDNTGLWAQVNANGRGSSAAQIAKDNLQWSGFAGKDNSNLKALGMSKSDIAALSGGAISSAERKQMEGLGISSKQINELHGGYTGQSEANRLNIMQKFIEQAQGTNPQNKIQSKPTSQDVNVKVNVGFTGKAASFFQQTGVTVNKANANAGQAAINAVVNSPSGDNSPIVRKAVASGATSPSALLRAQGIPTGR